MIDMAVVWEDLNSQLGVLARCLDAVGDTIAGADITNALPLNEESLDILVSRTSAVVRRLEAKVPEDWSKETASELITYLSERIAVGQYIVAYSGNETLTALLRNIKRIEVLLPGLVGTTSSLKSILT